MASTSLTETLEETLALFDGSGEPLTTPEVADRLDLGRRSTYERLERLVDHGRLETKKVGANARVWWRSPSTSTAGRAAGSTDWPATAESLVDVLGGTDVGVFVLAEDFEVVWINEATERYFGLDRERVLGRDKPGLIEEAVASVVADPEPFVDTVLATCEDNTYPERFECRVSAGDGRAERWLEYRSMPIESGAYAGGRVEFYYDVTDRKRSERARRDDRTQFESLVEAVEEYAIFMLDPDGRVRTWNAGAERIKGYDAAEVVGEHVSTFYTDEDRTAGVPEENLATAAEDGTVEDEGWRVRADGTRFWANVAITAVSAADDELEGYVKVVRDMTDQREYELRLQAEAERVERQRDLVERELDDMFERVDDAFLALDEDWRITYVNESAAELVRLPPGELLGARVWDVLPEVDDGYPRAMAERAFETQESAEFSFYSGMLDIWVEVRIYPSDTGLSVYFRDVTDRKQRERELVQYETLFEESKDVNVIVDAEGTFRYLTPSASNVFGYDPAELVGEVGFEYVHPDDREEALTEFARMIETPGYEPEIEFRFERADGAWIVLEALARDLRDDPDVDGIVIYTRDVTERKERERELERQHNQLVALDKLNEVVRDITEAVIEQSTREEIEAIVCERLADADSYEFAWIGDVDPHAQSITPRVEAGVDGYLEEIPLSTSPDDPTGRGPGGRAVQTREIQVTSDALTDPRFEPWREHAKRYGYRSSAAIPVVHGDTMYGLLGVYADRPRAFSGEERDVIAQLGEVVGHAIAAAERKRALMSDEVVELQFHVRDVFDALGVDAATPGTIELDHLVPIEDDEFIVYGRASADAVGGVEALVETVPHWVDVTFGTDGGETDFELRLSEPPVLSTVAELGGSVDSAVIEDGGYRMTFHLAPGRDVRQVIDAVQATYPAAELVKRHDITRPVDATERVGNVLTGGLTDRQRATLEAAYHAGFFEWPRDASGEDVAASLEIAPPTFHQHLRKAQRKVFESVFSAPAPT